MTDVVVDCSPHSVVRVSSPQRLPIHRRAAHLSPSVQVDLLEADGFPVRGVRLDRARREIGSLNEDLDHMRSELRVLRQDLKAPYVDISPIACAAGKTHVSISTADTTRYLDYSMSGISDKVDAMKLDLDTERRQRLARDDDATYRLRTLQQTAEANASHQFHTDGCLRKLEDKLLGLMSRMDLMCQDLDEARRSKKESDEALWAAIREVGESLAKEAAARAAKQEELRAEVSGLGQSLDQERSERQSADEKAEKEWKKDFERVASLESQSAQVREALEAKSQSLKSLLDAEKAARGEAVLKLERDLAELSRSLRAEKDSAEMRLTDFKDRCDKELEDKLRSHKHGLQVLVDSKIAELRESMDQNFVHARQARDSIQYALERERESRKAQSESQVASLEVRLEPVFARLGQAERLGEVLSSKAESNLEEHRSALKAVLEESVQEERKAIQSLRVELEHLRKKELQTGQQAEDLVSGVARLKEALDQQGRESSGKLVELGTRCQSWQAQLEAQRQDLDGVRQVQEKLLRGQEAISRLEERVSREEEFTTRLKGAAK